MSFLNLKNAITSQQAVTSYRKPDNTEFHVVLQRTTPLRKPLNPQIIHSFCLSSPCLKDCFVLKTRPSCHRVVDLKVPISVLQSVSSKQLVCCFASLGYAGSILEVSVSQYVWQFLRSVSHILSS